MGEFVGIEEIAVLIKELRKKRDILDDAATELRSNLYSHEFYGVPARLSNLVEEFSDNERKFLVDIYINERLDYLANRIAHMVLVASYDNFNYEGGSILKDKTFLKFVNEYKEQVIEGSKVWK